MYKIYRGRTGETRALHDVSISCQKGLLTVVAGPSGSGKSSLLRVLAGIDKPDFGSVDLLGIPLIYLRPAARRRLMRTHVGYVFQVPSDNLISYLTVREHIVLATRLRKARHTDADELLEALGLGSRAKNRPDELSGGEQQRVAFGMAAAGGASVVLADEPTAELDDASSTTLFKLIRSVASQGAAVVVASHDERVLAAADSVVRLDEGRVV